jgi:hypothetical protein
LPTIRPVGELAHAIIRNEWFVLAPFMHLLLSARQAHAWHASI